MAHDVQISAIIDVTTKEMLDRRVRATGVKKGYVIEQALRHYLQALQDLPADVVVPPRIVVSRRSGDVVRREMRRTQATPELRQLLRDGD